MDDTKETITSILKDLVNRVTCKPGWKFSIISEDSQHWSLQIFVPGPNSRQSGRISIIHSFPVPWATFNEKTWRRWIFDCCRRVEDHELAEWFKIDDERSFAPLHGPGEDPYTVHEFRPIKDALTNQSGEIENPDGISL